MNKYIDGVKDLSLDDKFDIAFKFIEHIDSKMTEEEIIQSVLKYHDAEEVEDINLLIDYYIYMVKEIDVSLAIKNHNVFTDTKEYIKDFDYKQLRRMFVRLILS